MAALDEVVGFLYGLINDAFGWYPEKPETLDLPYLFEPTDLVDLDERFDELLGNSLTYFGSIFLAFSSGSNFFI